MNKTLKKYFPKGLLIGYVPKYKIINTVRFPMKEYIDTIKPEELPSIVVSEKEQLAFWVGLGFVTAVVIFSIVIFLIERGVI